MTTLSERPSRGSLVSQALAKDRLGVWTVVSIVGGAIAPLTVVAGGATTGWAVSGILAIPLAYLVVAGLLIMFSSGYTAMISRGSMSAGPLYAIPARGLGRPVGVGSGLIAIWAYLPLKAGLIGGFGAVGAPLLAHELGWSAPWWAWSLAALLTISVLGVLGVDIVGKILAVLLALETLVAVVLAVVMLRHPAGGHIDYSALSPRQILQAGFAAAGVIAVTGYVGFEGTGNMSEESKNPRRTIRMATRVTLVIAALLYGGASFAMVAAAGPSNIVALATKDGTDTMFNLAAPYVPHWLIIAGHFLLLSSLFAGALAFHALISRYQFVFGREGVFPRGLARTSAHSNVPFVASIITSVITLIIVGLFVVTGWDPLTKLFFQGTVVGGFGVLLLMNVASAAIAVYFARPGNRVGVGVVRGIVAPVLALIGLGFLTYETLKQFSILLGITPDDPLRWIFPAAYGAIFVVGVAVAVWLRQSRPASYEAIGTSEQPKSWSLA